MRSSITKQSLSLIQEEGVRVYPQEACGLIVKVGRKSVTIACTNSAQDKVNEFIIAPEEFARASDTGEVIAVWHTHTERSPNPSLPDTAMCDALGLPWYILAVHKNSDETFRFEGPVLLEPRSEPTPYVGRPYLFGIHDCYSLVVDFYKREYGVKLGNNYPRIREWWNEGHDFFTENFKAEGFVELIDQEIVRGDVFLIQSGASVPNHVAIYLGDEKILHHCHGRLSTRDVYGGYWLKHTCKTLRYAHHSSS